MNQMTVRTATQFTARTLVPPTENDLTHFRSHTMYALHEALAREHQREYEQRAREVRLANQFAGERRHRMSLRRRRSARR